MRIRRGQRVWLVSRYERSTANQWHRQNLQVGGGSFHAEGVRIKASRESGVVGWGLGHNPLPRIFFRFSPIKGAIWCTFSTFWKPSSWCHCFFSRLGRGTCPHLPPPPPVTTLLQLTDAQTGSAWLVRLLLPGARGWWGCCRLASSRRRRRWKDWPSDIRSCRAGLGSPRARRPSDRPGSRRTWTGWRRTTLDQTAPCNVAA